MKYVALVILTNIAYICFTQKEYHAMLLDFMNKKIPFNVRIK